MQLLFPQLIMAERFSLESVVDFFSGCNNSICEYIADGSDDGFEVMEDNGDVFAAVSG